MQKEILQSFQLNSQSFPLNNDISAARISKKATEPFCFENFKYDNPPSRKLSHIRTDRSENTLKEKHIHENKQGQRKSSEANALSLTNLL